MPDLIGKTMKPSWKDEWVLMKKVCTLRSGLRAGVGICLFVLVVLLAYTPSFAAPINVPAPVDAGNVHTVVSGDTLYHIARVNGTHWSVLAEYNQISSPRLIFPGQRIRIPDEVEGSSLSRKIHQGANPFLVLAGYYNLFAASEPISFVTTQRINPNMPEFTFHRILGAYIPDPWLDIPSPREVSIIIKDEHGNVIQSILDLIQNYRHATLSFGEIEFADFNFDGYLDMRLTRWHDGGESSRMIDYVWLWDIQNSQFVLNDQLTRLDTAGITANQDTRQIETWIRHSDGCTTSFYEYNDGEFILVAHERIFLRWDERGYQSHVELIRTNVITG